MASGEIIILDDIGACSFRDCPDPMLINRFIKDGELNKEENAFFAYYLDECQKCQEYEKSKRQNLEKEVK